MLGLSTFADFIEDRSLCVFSDTVRSEHCAKRGSAKHWDHTCIVHSIWRRAAALKTALWIERVPTDDNIADLPSREDYDLLERIGAQWLPPVIDEAFLEPAAWSALTVKNILSRYASLALLCCIACIMLCAAAIFDVTSRFGGTTHHRMFWRPLGSIARLPSPLAGARRHAPLVCVT